MSSSYDVGVVDLRALRLPAVLSAHLLPAIRALQSRNLAGAACGPAGGSRDPGAASQTRGVEGSGDFCAARGELAVGGMGVSPCSVLVDQLGGDVFRNCLRGGGLSAGG